MNKFELFKEKLKTCSEEKLNTLITRGILKLSENQIQTVSFIFWISYMAEIDLHKVIDTAWQKSNSVFSKEVGKVASQMFRDIAKQELGKEAHPKDLQYFGDKIKVYRTFFGENARTKLLDKINDLRNDISHNRINNLLYAGQNLELRSAKEKLLIDYTETAITQDFTKSKFWSELSDEEKQEIEQLSAKLWGSQ
ncbi:MAG: hypothetical protein A2915_02385 [Candidatus Yanofskybacteria bacterium RIFCSPLOWO2_01_FULL_41_34]|nr:MAG: hypothetical protein A2915_02385 [Candidatus Yanofskybacteria bacterium RIFCSPLOWO2_01_FULL_41_34]